MAITQIQNPYKLAQMQPFTYKKDESGSNNPLGGVSKGLGLIAPPSAKMVAESEPQDTLELVKEDKQNIQKVNDNIKKFVNRKRRHDATDDLPTPLGVKLIAGAGCLIAVVAMLKKSGVLGKIANIFRKVK